MFGSLDYSTLQQLWWFIATLVGSLFVFMTFVQGGQTLLSTLSLTEDEKVLVTNSLGRKWELTFTCLVMFGGALFAAFPLFYATSFGGAYWVWILILFTFILQAVSYEYRKKPSNILGARTYEIFLFINGSVGIILIGAAIGTFFTGSNFSLNDYNLVTWHSPLRGLEAAFNLFNLSFGLFLMFVSRVLGALYLHNNIDQQNIRERTSKAAFNNLLFSLPFLLYILFSLVTMDGFAVAPRNGKIFLESGKYLHNLLAMPIHGLGFLLVAHEMAHQWFGDYVTCATWQDIWINEGFASYVEYLALEHLKSRQEADDWMENAHAEALKEPDGSVYVPFDEVDNVWRIFSGRLSYKKGASLLHMIRYELDDDTLFYAVLREYLQEYGDSTATGRDFEQVLERVSGKDFTWFFNQWYYGAGYPLFDISWWERNDTLYIHSEETPSGSMPFFRTHIDFLLHGEDGDTLVRFLQDDPERKRRGRAGGEVVLRSCSRW